MFDVNLIFMEDLIGLFPFIITLYVLFDIVGVLLFNKR